MSAQPKDRCVVRRLDPYDVAVSPLLKALSSADQSLLDHAAATLYFLRCYDHEWDGDIEIAPTNFVKVTTRRAGTPGPSLRLTRITMPPQEQAMVIHEATVGRARARRNRAEYERYESYQIFDTATERAKHRYNAKKRERRATDPEWRESENQKRRERSERQRSRATEATVHTEPEATGT